MEKKIRIAPSILSANFANLEQDIKKVEPVADLLHLDVMDGHFVPNITFGPPLVKSVRKVTNLFLDVHLMIEEPQKYIKPFTDAGADNITFHIEVTNNPEKIVKMIRDEGKQVGITLNPDTPVEKIFPVLDIVDMVLIMSVFPGFGGQKFIVETLEKVEKIKNRNDKLYIEIDGGINKQTVAYAAQAGVDTIVAGTAIFGADNPAQAAIELRKIAENARISAGK